MRIVKRKEFLSLPSGTLYSEYISSGMVHGLYEKGDSWTNDWIYADLLGEPKRDNDTEFHDVFDKLEQGTEFELDLECGSRDGSFKEDAMFFIYDKHDIRKLINKLSELESR